MTLQSIAQTLGYIVTIVGFLVALWKVIKKLGVVADGLKSLLRSDIMAIYYRHCDEEEPTLREYERKTLDALYDAYTAQGGNSFVSDLYNDQMRHWHVTR